MKNYRATKFYNSIDSYAAISIAEGFCEGEPTEDEILASWQFIIDKGIWKGLQGWFGRTCHQLIEEGLLKPAKN